MSIDYYSAEGIGIVFDDDDEVIETIKQKMVEQYGPENSLYGDELDDFEPDLDEFFSEDENIVYHKGGNFVAEREICHMFVCPGSTLKEQIENIPNFLIAMNKYIPESEQLTEDDLNTVSVWQVM